MKYLFVFFLVLSAQFGFSQESAKTITTAINQNNGASIVKYFNDDTDITVLDEDEIGKDGYELVFKFFNTNKVSSFKVKHEGTSKLGDVYRIGDMVTNTGSYRVTFFTKNSSTGLIVIQFKVEEI